MKKRELVLKKKIIKINLFHSEIFTESYLNPLGLDELESLQKTALIELYIKHKF